MTQINNPSVTQLKQKNERVKLTDSLVTKLNVRAKEYLVRDTEVKSLFIKVQTTGNKSYFVQQGQKKKKVAVVGEVTVAQARKLAMELLANGFDFKEKALLSKLSVLSAYDEYIKSKVFAKGFMSTVNQSKRVFAPILKKPISELTKDQIRSCINNATKVDGSPMADSTLDTCINVLSSVFSYQLSLEKIESNPCQNIRVAGMKQLSPNVRNTRLTSAADFEAFHRWYLSEPDGSGVSTQNKKDFLVVRDTVLFILLTGCRVGEAINLKTKDIWLNEELELRENRIRPRELTFKETKNGTDHTLQMTPLINQLIFSAVEANRGTMGSDCEYVFRCVARKEQVSENAMYGRIKKALDKLVLPGGEGLNPHDLRRTFAHHASKVLADSVVKTVMNHKSKANMTERYAGELVDITKDALLSYQRAIEPFFYEDDEEKRVRVYGFGLLRPYSDGTWTKDLAEIMRGLAGAKEDYLLEYDSVSFERV